jgi:bifunctional N-acetylglucosamine-1-phosphate-uridyltransferase/glucosamine-1-phosphate-acetyltransferase GlmU-like protein
MVAGATLADPARIDVRGGEVEVERDVFIDVNAVFIGKVHLAARVRIGPNCIIKDASIGADTEVLRELRHRQRRDRRALPYRTVRAPASAYRARGACTSATSSRSRTARSAPAARRTT